MIITIKTAEYLTGGNTLRCNFNIHNLMLHCENFTQKCLFIKISTLNLCSTYLHIYYLSTYSVIHNSIAPSKELCSKMALGEVGVSLHSAAF